MLLLGCGAARLSWTRVAHEDGRVRHAATARRRGGSRRTASATPANRSAIGPARRSVPGMRAIRASRAVLSLGVPRSVAAHQSRVLSSEQRPPTICGAPRRRTRVIIGAGSIQPIRVRRPRATDKWLPVDVSPGSRPTSRPRGRRCLVLRVPFVAVSGRSVAVLNAGWPESSWRSCVEAARERPFPTGLGSACRSVRLTDGAATTRPRTV